MKKIIYISTLFILSLSLKLKAQDDVIYGGFKIAPNYSVITDKADKWTSGIGYSLGYFEVLELNYKMNLQAEINYSRYVLQNEIITGYDNAGNPTTTKKNKTYRSFEIPVMAKYRVNNFAIGLGYQISFRTKLKDETNEYYVQNGNIQSAADEESEPLSLKSLFSPKYSTGGVFLDASFKSDKIIGGLRILQTNKALIDDTHRSLNASVYFGISLL